MAVAITATRTSSYEPSRGPPLQEIVNDVDIETLCGKDSIFAGVLRQYGPPPNWRRDQGFVSLSRIILEQQVSLESADAHFRKLSSYVSEFSPAEILKLSDTEMRTCQISRQKAAYLRALANAVIAKTLVFEDFEALSDTEIRERLIAIKGIGNWTADIYLMFCMQRKDLFPAGDIAVMNAAMELCGTRTKDAVIERSESWAPNRSLAAYFFWHHYLKKRNR